MRRFRPSVTTAKLCCAVALAVLALAGCKRNAPPDAVPPVAGEPVATDPTTGANPLPADAPSATDAGSQADASASNPLVVATAGAAAPYLANRAGNALYFVEGDTDGSKCSGDCTKTWPPVLVADATPSDSPGLDPSMIGMLTRADGSTQVSYNRHPLYRYAADGGAGRTAGHGVSDQWGHWSLIGPDGAPVPSAK